MCAYYIYRIYLLIQSMLRNKQLNWAAPQNKAIGYCGLIEITQQDGDSSSRADTLQFEQSAVTKSNMRTYVFIWLVYIFLLSPFVILAYLCSVSYICTIHATPIVGTAAQTIVLHLP